MCACAVLDICPHICVCVYVYVCMCVCVCVCMCKCVWCKRYLSIYMCVAYINISPYLYVCCTMVFLQICVCVCSVKDISPHICVCVYNISAYWHVCMVYIAPLYNTCVYGMVHDFTLHICACSLQCTSLHMYMQFTVYLSPSV